MYAVIKQSIIAKCLRMVWVPEPELIRCMAVLEHYLFNRHHNDGKRLVAHCEPHVMKVKAID
jgi:glycerol-3-phosphate acyltransferase PlsY